MSRTLEEVRRAISDKEREIHSLGEDLNGLRKLRAELESKSDEDHFRNPQPGDFWHEMYSPVLIVLQAGEEEVVVCEKTVTVYEDPDQEMVMRSYANPDDPEVRKYFSKPRKDIGYTFDLEGARRIGRSEFEGILKCYSGAMKDEIAYRCIPGRAAEFARIWAEKK